MWIKGKQNEGVGSDQILPWSGPSSVGSSSLLLFSSPTTPRSQGMETKPQQWLVQCLKKKKKKVVVVEWTASCVSISMWFMWNFDLQGSPEGGWKDAGVRKSKKRWSRWFSERSGRIGLFKYVGRTVKYFSSSSSVHTVTLFTDRSKWHDIFPLIHTAVYQRYFRFYLVSSVTSTVWTKVLEGPKVRQQFSIQVSGRVLRQCFHVLWFIVEKRVTADKKT